MEGEERFHKTFWMPAKPRVRQVHMREKIEGQLPKGKQKNRRRQINIPQFLKMIEKEVEVGKKRL